MGVLLPEHRRVNERLREYWDDLRGNLPFPAESEIDPTAIDEIWDSVFLVRADEEDDGMAFKYMYLGQSLVEAYGEDGESKEVCEKLAYPANNNLIGQFKTVIQSQAPVIEESEFTNSQGMIIKFRSIMLPLSKDQPDRATYVIGAMKWKAC